MGCPKFDHLKWLKLENLTFVSNRKTRLIAWALFSLWSHRVYRTIIPYAFFPLPATKRPALAFGNHQSAESIIQAVLTVVAVSPRVRRHRAVTGEVLPLLDAHTHVGARVLLAGCAWAWENAGTGKEMPQEKVKSSNTSSYFWAFTIQ